MPTKPTKTCPFCWEEILAAAKKCKYCWEMLKTEEEIEEEKNFQPLVYGKNTAIKVLSILVWWLFSLSFIFMWIWVKNTPSQNQNVETTEWTWDTATVTVQAQDESSPWNFFIFIWLCFLIPIWQLFMKKLIIDKDHVTIKSWIIFKKKEDIKYNKINNIQQSSFLGFWWIKIFTWNDKPVVFDNLESYQDVITFINKKIDR